MIENLRLKVLVEDSVSAKAKSKGFISRHGLSIIVYAKANNVDACILMDVSPSAETLLRNVDAAAVDLRKIDAILLSHGHYDHVDGLRMLLRASDKKFLFLPIQPFSAQNFHLRTNGRECATQFQVYRSILYTFRR